MRGLKRKAFRKETTEEKADRGRRAKKALIDSLWQAGARKEKGTSEEKNSKVKAGPEKRGRNPNKVQLAKNKGSA